MARKKVATYEKYLFLCLFHDSVALKQSIDFWFTSSEFHIESHRIFGRALREQFLERFGCSRVEDAIFFEFGESIGIEHFRPLVAIIAGRIHAGENVSKLWRTDI